MGLFFLILAFWKLIYELFPCVKFSLLPWMKSALNTSKKIWKHAPFVLLWILEMNWWIWRMFVACLFSLKWFCRDSKTGKIVSPAWYFLPKLKYIKWHFLAPWNIWRKYICQKHFCRVVILAKKKMILPKTNQFKSCLKNLIAVTCYLISGM